VSEWAHNHPEEMTEIARLPLSQQNSALRAAMSDPLEIADQRRKEAIENSFTPWHKDPIRLARLWRFLELMDRPPIDVPAFLENASTYEDEYQLMQSLTEKA
jgi:hypothetical protein